MTEGLPCLVIRADASRQIGTGHLMRCLALAQAYKEINGSVLFITRCESQELLQRLTGEGFEVMPLAGPYPSPEDLETTLKALSDMPGAFLVLDGYHLDSEYQRLIKQAGHRLMVIDDTAHLPCYHADVILNQNPYASQLRYTAGFDARILLGTRYVLLRREFTVWRGWKREFAGEARRVLVTLGGSDTDNVTLEVVKALGLLKRDLEVRVVLGASYPYLEELRSEAESLPFPVRLDKNVYNMPELMAWADIAVAAGGTTCLELLYMGLPSVLLVLADNQLLNTLELAKNDASICVKARPGGVSFKQELFDRLEFILNSHRHRVEAGRRGRELVDGEGATRVARMIRGGCYEH